MEEEQTIEELEKAAHYWKDKDPAKYKKMLGKLKSQRKAPGHKERAQQQILQAKRRERGGSGTTAGQDGKSGHSSGHMSGKHGSAVKRYQSSEKKAGTKLSPDRKDNDKGYAAGNVRNIPQKLNRGAHKADEKKVSEWRKKLKKHNIDIDQFMTLLQAKALNKGQDELYGALSIIDLDTAMEHLEKWKQHGKTWRPEESDADGATHPEKDWHMKSTSKIGKPVSAYTDKIQEQHEKEFDKHLDGFKGKSKDYQDNPKFASLVDKISEHVKSDPDKHVIASGTSHDWDGNKQSNGRRLMSQYKEPRLRHLKNALSHSDNLKPHPEGGVTFHAERHSGNNKNPDLTQWRVRNDGKDGITIQSEHTHGDSGKTSVGNLHDTEKATSKRVRSNK